LLLLLLVHALCPLLLFTAALMLHETHVQLPHHALRIMECSDDSLHCLRTLSCASLIARRSPSRGRARL
jgi:hypothetical protein